MREERKDRLISAAAGAGVGLGAGAITSGISRSLMKDHAKDTSKFESVLSSLGTKEMDISDPDGNRIRAYKMPSGKHMIVNTPVGKVKDFMVPNVGDSSAVKSLGINSSRVQAYVDARKNVHYIKSSGDHTALLHELGHSAKARKYGVPFGRYTPHTAITAILPTTGVMTERRSDESENDYQKRVGKRVALTTAGAVALNAPTLAEEARASINASRIGKKIGVKPNRAHLLKAYGTYAGKGLVLPVVAGLGTYGMFKLKRREHEKTANLEDRVNDRISEYRLRKALQGIAMGSLGAGIATSIPSKHSTFVKHRIPLTIGGGLLGGAIHSHLSVADSDKLRKKIRQDELSRRI
jgi:hypothetical protein